MSHREGQFHIKQTPTPPTAPPPPPVTLYLYPGPQHPLAEFCVQLVTISWAGPPSLIKFHSRDNKCGLSSVNLRREEGQWSISTSWSQRKRELDITSQHMQKKIAHFLCSLKLDAENFHLVFTFGDHDDQKRFAFSFFTFTQCEWTYSHLLFIWRELLRELFSPCNGEKWVTQPIIEIFLPGKSSPNSKCECAHLVQYNPLLSE